MVKLPISSSKCHVTKKGLADAPIQIWRLVNCGCVCPWGDGQNSVRVDVSGKDKESIVWNSLCIRETQRGRASLSVTGGVLVICHRIRYPDKAIREKQIPQPHGFNSLVPHPDELLKNGVWLKLVLYERLQICLLSRLLPPVFIGCKGLLINLPLLLSGRRGRGQRGVASQHPNKYTSTAVRLSNIPNQYH